MSVDIVVDDYEVPHCSVDKQILGRKKDQRKKQGKQPQICKEKPLVNYYLG